MIKLTVDHMEEAYMAANLLFTNLSPVDYKPSHNVYRNDHFLNAFNIVIDSSSHKNEIVLEELGYTKSKILHLCKSYLDPVEYTDWIKQIGEVTENYGRVDSDIGVQTTRNSRHSNGPCLFGFSFRSHIEPILTVYSRSIELPQIYGADTLLISAMAQHIADTIGVENIKVIWYISSARIKSRVANFFRLYTYPYTQYTFTNPEFQAHVDKQWNNILANQEKKVTFSKLIKLQEEYKRVVIDEEQPATRSGTQEFLVRLKEGWKV